MRFSPGATIRRAALAVGLSVSLLAAGCANPGVVAYVGNTAITQKQVEAAVAAVTTTVQQGETVSTEAVINAMIQGELAQQIADDQRISITDSERDTFLKTTNLVTLLNVPSAKPVAYDVADTQIVSRHLGAAAYLAQIEKRTVRLNPRFGVLDPKQKTIVPGQTGSLARPVAVQTP
jgi:hypothetical protein